jgi:hypothetical protein
VSQKLAVPAGKVAPNEVTGVTVEELSVIEVTPDAIVAVSKDGNRFSIPVDATVRSGVNAKSSTGGAHVTPREIQALLRSGLSASEVASRVGQDVESIARFEAPITAELAFVLERALAVPVSSHSDDEPQTFGGAITARISAQGGSVGRWQAYRRDDEWIVGAEFHVGDVVEDATWVFDPRKLTLAPSNSAAVRVSKADAVDAALFPPLRVVAPTTPQRFDSGEFEAVPPNAVVEPRVEPQSVKPVDSRDPNETVSELLDDLQRRRGERAEAMSSHPSSGSIPVITPEMLEMPDSPESPDDTLFNEPAPTADAEPLAPAAADDAFVDETPSQRHRRTRAAMPTWDEIVFGTRPDSD